MTQLKEVKIGDILELQRGYDLPIEEMQTGDVIVAGSNGIIGYHNIARSNNPCITVGRSGSVGKVHFYEQPTWAHNTALYVKDFKGNNPVFLYYFLKNLHLDKLFGKSSSVVPSLDRKIVHAMSVPFIEDKEEQLKIASVLSNIDNKIIQDREICRNIEALASQLFNYWFVQFDFPDTNGNPYKSSGGIMEYNTLLKREIPKGWEVKPLSEIANICRGSIITEAQTVQGDVKVVAAAVSYSYFHNAANRKANVITISSSGANAGYMNFWREPIFASDCMTIQCESDIDTILTYYQLRLYRNGIMQRSHGSAQPHVYPSDIQSLPFVCVPKEYRDKIENLYITWNREIANKSKEIEQLVKQRDALLPVLMNGQVSVRDVKYNKQ